MTGNEDSGPLRESHEEDGDGVPPPVPATYAPSRRDDVFELDMQDGLVLFDPESSLVHHLNATARILWLLLDGKTSVRSLSDDIASEFGLDPVEIGRQVATLVAELEVLGLIEDRGTRVPDA